MEKEKNKKAITLIPIAMMFLVIGLTFDHINWLKYTFMGISIVLSSISLVISLKGKIGDKS